MEQKPEGNNMGNEGNQPEIILSSPSAQGVDPVNSKVCPQCGTANGASSVYCFKCGAKLPDAASMDKKICSGCGTPNLPTSQYCYKCGLKLSEIASAGMPPMKYAGFWIRLLAFIIDAILLNIVSSIISSIFIFSVFDLSEYMDMISDMLSTGIIDDRYWSFLGLSLLASLAGLAVEIAYRTIGIGKWGKTIGKAALGLKVVKTDGSRVSYWRAFGRSCAYILNGFTLGIGFLIVAFTQKKQGLHDFICDTVVIKTNK